MKGKTKGERKNKSIKKNQIPAFMLTGGENEYNTFQTTAQAMNYAVEQVENKMKKCTDENEILQDIAKKETENKNNLIIKLKKLQSNMSNLEISANKVTNLQTQMDTCTKEKGDLQRQIDELNSQNKELTTQNSEINGLKQQLKTAQDQAVKEAIDAKELADNEAIAAQELAAKQESDAKELAESKKLSTENEAKPYAKDFMNEIIPKASEKPQLIGELEKKIKLFEEEKIVLDAQIVENKLKINNCEEKYNELKKQYDTLQKEHQNCTDKLKQLKDEHEATFYKLLQLVNGTNIDNLSEDTKNEFGAQDETINKIIDAINGKLTGVKEEQEEQHNVDTNTKIEYVKNEYERKIEEMKTGKSNELGDITNMITEQTQQLEGLINKKTNAEEIINKGNEAQETVKKAQNDLAAIKSEADEAHKTINDAVAAKSEADAAKSEADAAKSEVGQANEKCAKDLETANKALEQATQEKTAALEQATQEKTDALAAAEKEKKQCEEQLTAAKSEMGQAEQAKTDALAALVKATERINPLESSNESLRGKNTELEKQLANSEKECDERVAAANAARTAGDENRSRNVEPTYKEEDTIINNLTSLNKDTLPNDDKLVITNSINRVNNPKDTDINDDMDYAVERNYDNISNFKDKYINGERTDYKLKTHKINNSMIFLYVHEKYKKTDGATKNNMLSNYVSMYDNDKNDNNRQIYICKVDKISENNITTDCWNISPSMNTLLNGYKDTTISINSEYHQQSITLNTKKSNNILFKTTPHTNAKEVRNNIKNIKIYRELLTPIIHTTSVRDKKDQNQNIYLPNHATNGNLEGIKNQNIIPVYPYGQDSFQLLRRTTGDPTFQTSVNYIIYLTDYESTIEKSKYFPIKENKNDTTFTMFFKNSVEIRYLHTLIHNNKKGFLKLKNKNDEPYLNIGADIGYKKQEQKQPNASQETNRRLMANIMPKNPRGGKKNLTKYKGMLNSKKGGYRYSALGMKGLTIDLSGLKAKKTRRIKKKGKTVKNKNGSRKSKKGSRKDKTKKNKRRGRTYRNKK